MADYTTRFVEKTIYKFTNVGGGDTVVRFVGPPTGSGPPEIINVSPANLATLNPDDPIRFDVKFNNTEVRTIIIVKYPDLTVAPEVVYDGTLFSPLFGNCTRTATETGWRYVVRRDRGWPSRPAPVIYAFDEYGDEA